MNIITKTIKEYQIDRDWKLQIEESDDETAFFLCHARTGNAKLVDRIPGKSEDLEKDILEVVRTVSGAKEDNMFDMAVNPQHLVSTISGMWETCRGENEFLTNVAYMVIGSISRAYSEMWGSDKKWQLEATELPVGTAVAIHKVGEMLSSVEHNVGTVNAAAKNRNEPI